MLRSRIGRNRILRDLYTAKDHPGWVNPESSVAVILLEIALKGPSLPVHPEYSRVPRDGLLVRSYAAGWAGLYNDPDVVPVLLMLAKEAGDNFLRNCALIGLRNKTGDDVTEIFLSALLDQNLAIRDLAAYELRMKSGQDFGIDQSKHRAWFETIDVGKKKKP